MWSDVLDQNEPYFRWVWAHILAGKSPFWTPNLFGGFSAIGSGQFAIFYPPNVLFAINDPVWAQRFWIIAHLWGGALGLYLYAYRRFRSVPGAVVGAIGFFSQRLPRKPPRARRSLRRLLLGALDVARH